MKQLFHLGDVVYAEPGRAVISAASYNKPNNYWLYEITLLNSSYPRSRCAWFMDDELSLVEGMTVREWIADYA